ncbi:MAG: DUF4837 family protein [Cyclobacteriaceae bacterium]
MKNTFLPLIFSSILWSCSDNKGESNLPPAMGLSGDVYVVMDSAQRKGPLGQAIDSMFSADMEVINRTEPIFKVRWIDARKLNTALKQRRNVVFAVTLNQNSVGANRIKGMFNQESIDRIKSDTTFFLIASKDQFAKNQEVMFLVGKTQEALIKKINKNRTRIVEYFDKSERERLSVSLFKAGQLKGTTDLMRQKFGVEIKIPFGYQLVQHDSTFLWVRQINPKDDRDIFIARKRYRSRDQFQLDSLIQFRNDVCKKYLFGNPEKPQSFLVTEMAIPYKLVQAKQVTFENKYAVELRGLWRTNNITMGGPFLSYSLVDEAQGMLYYIEGFTYAPGKPQREIMRELETILHTFKTSGEWKEKENK